jgi:Predicted transcriptional regulators
MDLRLLELRREKRLTQDDVAKHMKISRQAYALYETNQRHMNYDSLRILAELFSVSIDYLLGGKNRAVESLSEGEVQLVHKFRALDERGQSSVKALVDFEHSQVVKETKKATG